VKRAATVRLAERLAKLLDRLLCARKSEVLKPAAGVRGRDTRDSDERARLKGPKLLLEQL
jgi:hypothetical protein